MRWTSYGELRLYSTYILSNNSMTLYIGVTNNLARRIAQHKRGEGSEFTSRYHFDRLVYFETNSLMFATRLRGETAERMDPETEDRVGQDNESQVG